MTYATYANYARTKPLRRRRIMTPSECLESRKRNDERLEWLFSELEELGGETA